MRLKTMPRQRRPNYPYGRARGSGSENIRSTDIAQDVNEELTNIAEYGRMLDGMKKPEATKYEVSGNLGCFGRVQFSSGKYVPQIGLAHDVKSSIQESFEALNLSTKNGFGTTYHVKNDTVGGSSAAALDDTRSGDKFAGSLLYKIMTDPTFVENIKNNKEIAKLTCKFCKSKFANHDELQNHLESRMNEFDRIACCACGKTFGQKRYLRYHQRCHVVNDKFTCEICTKKYSRMDNLTRHKAYHINPDKYPCDVCDRTFSRRDLMTKHLKSHVVKKFHCEFCIENFHTFGEMKAHRLTLHSVINMHSNH